MDQLLDLGEIPQSSKLENLSQKELIQRLDIAESELTRVLRENYKLRQLKITDEQLQLLMQEQLESLRDAEYGTSSERYKKAPKKDEPKAPPKHRIKKPSERYPHLPIREQLITQNPAPNCPCCGDAMMDSGMTEDSEQLTVIPKKYEILLQKKVKFRCHCQGAIVTAQAPARIIPGSSYSDEMVQDVVLSKYCDLIPIQRYAAMAGRGGVKDIPPQSLIELTHPFADFVSSVYTLIKKGALASRTSSYLPALSRTPQVS
jgi:transposase